MSRVVGWIAIGLALALAPSARARASTAPSEATPAAESAKAPAQKPDSAPAPSAQGQTPAEPAKPAPSSSPVQSEAPRPADGHPSEGKTTDGKTAPEKQSAEQQAPEKQAPGVQAGEKQAPVTQAPEKPADKKPDAPVQEAQKPAQTESPAEQAPHDTPAAALPEFTPSYRNPEQLAELAKSWILAAPELVHALDLGAGTQSLVALEIAKPGPIAPADRPTLFLIGGLDGLSLAGGEAVLAVVSDLLRHADALPADLAFVALPWASPDALREALVSDVGDGRNLRPTDDDHDGKVDEDGPDDLDGDGWVLQMLIEDSRGVWAKSSDPRFLVKAGPADGVRYSYYREGRDDDHDGRFNEDPKGGVVLDRNFPVGRVGSWNDDLAGPLPLSEPIARAIADLIIRRRSVCALFFQGNHGSVAAPGGVATKPGEAELVAADDRPLFERVSETFQIATGRRQKSFVTLREARGGDRSGAAVDWTYAVGRALAVEVAMWGPLVEAGADVTAQDARYAQNGKPHAPGFGNGRSPPSDSDRAWAQWLDNSRGGIGFVDWHPVQLENGVQALVGGWEPRTIVNPPNESLPRAIKGAAEFVRQLVAGMPRLDIRVVSAVRDGEVCRIRARVKNEGLLPTGLAARRGVRAAQGLEIALDLPAGSQLLAGRAKLARERLLGGATTDEYEWVVLAPEGSNFVLRATSEWSVPAVKELKP